MAILGLFLEWENRQSEPPVSKQGTSAPIQAAHSAGSTRPPAAQAPSARTAEVEEAAGPLDALSLERWRTSSSPARMAYSVDYVSARARFGTPEDLKNVAIWLESCISMQKSFATVEQATSACFADLLRRQPGAAGARPATQ
jgi:hypothetical protein